MTQQQNKILNRRFHEIFGDNKKTFTEERRKKNWEEWRATAIEVGATDAVEYWESTSACDGCKHLDKTWCSREGLLCTVNPILSFQLGIIGMACRGMGYEVKKLELFENE